MLSSWTLASAHPDLNNERNWGLDGLIGLQLPGVLYRHYYPAYFSVRYIPSLGAVVFSLHYLRTPPGCGELSGRTVLLDKSLYGLKQATRTLHDLLIDTLKSIGFERHPSEPRVLRLLQPDSDTVRMMIAVHVDDMIVARNDDDCDWLRTSLSEVFPINNLGPLTWCTECAFERDRELGTMKIHQAAFVDSMLRRFSIATTRFLPADPSTNLRDGSRTKNRQRQNTGRRLGV